MREACKVFEQELREAVQQGTRGAGERGDLTFLELVSGMTRVFNAEIQGALAYALDQERKILEGQGREGGDHG